eukprot:scaffold11039_cov43-Phaeocystis_antarctica.AAC.1
MIIRVSTPRRRHNGRRRGNGKISSTTTLVSASSCCPRRSRVSQLGVCLEQGVQGSGLDCLAARLILGSSFSGHL